MKKKMYYKGYKIEKFGWGYKVYVRWLLFWWLSIQTPPGYYTFFRTDRIFDSVRDVIDYIDGKE